MAAPSLVSPGSPVGSPYWTRRMPTRLFHSADIEALRDERAQAAAS
jgi:hypothetical protein